MQNHSFSFIELLCVLAIAAVIYAFALPGISHYIYGIHAKLTVQQIQQAINYGRSLAIAHNQVVTVCPSQDHLTCSGSWRDGILVIAPNGRVCFFKVYLAAHSALSLSQSGFNPQKMTIETSGMTHQNGKFDYKSLKFSGFPQFNLYFNKALRIYMVSG